MAQSLTLKAKGRYTSVNELSEVPEGALLEADDVSIDSDGIVEPRRGFDRATDAFSDVADRCDALFFYQDKLFAHLGTYLSADALYYWSGSAWVSVGALAAPSGARVHTAKSNQNVYMTTSAGIKALSAYNGSLRAAGAYKGLDITTALTGATGFMTDTYSVAYRVIWGFRDANSNLITGAPSARNIITNTAGGAATRDVSVTVTVPSGVTTDWIYQVYRSPQSTTSDPSDDLQLVYEGSPSSGEISAGYLTFTDIVPDSLRGAALYTNANQEGIAYGNEQPPLAKDIASFADCMFYLNTTSKHRYYLTLIAVGGSTGLAANDTITFGGVTFTAKASPATSTEFTISTGGTAAQNIKDTAQALCQKVNRNASCTVYAFYLSGPDDTPGKVLLEERTLGGSAFNVTASRATCWTPTGIPTSGTTQASTNDTYENGLYWSKPGQPEAVPLVNFKPVGSKESAGLRCIALKEALFVLKEDGIWKVTGTYPNFNIEQFDNSAKLIAPETCAVLNGQIFCLTDQGVTSISDGTRVLSQPIEDDIVSMFGDGLDTLRDQAFGVAFEAARKYYLFMPTSADDAAPAVAHVYNTFTQAWVRHVRRMSKTAGVVEANQLYLANSDEPYVAQERRSFTFADYADYGAATTVTAQTDDVVTLGSNVDLAEAGDVLYQSAEAFAIILEVDSVAGTVTLDAPPTFSVAAAEILKAIPARVVWAPVTLANPGVTKALHTAELFFKDDYYGTGYVTFQSDLVPTETAVPIEGQGLAVWGLFAWGEEPWGGEAVRRPVRQWVPRDYQRCSQLLIGFEHAYAFSPWKLQGVSLFGDIGSEKTTR